METPTLARRLRRLPTASVLGCEVPVAAGSRARLLGLAGLERERAGDGLLIPRCSSVHTFAMRFALDLVFLDADGRVLSTRRGVGPRRVVSDRRAAAVLELPARHNGRVTSVAQPKYVYRFAEGSREMRDLLGGKGANIAEMARLGPPIVVPAGFTVTTEACVAFLAAGGELPEGLDEQLDAALAALEREAGRRLGDPEDPLLVSVRSGARESMPGMMDTVLNLGLGPEAVGGLAARTANPRFAWDSHRRFVQMFGNVVAGIDGMLFERAIRAVKAERGVALDTELDAGDLRRLVEDFERIFREETGREFPRAPREQLGEAVAAVFRSWNGARAVEYRRLNRIPDEWGTAVNVQQMVFGNRGEGSGSGVAFSRDEMTGEPRPSGDFLRNAQGEDVVSGTRDTADLDEMARILPEAHAQLVEIVAALERHFGDMQDVEFTVEEGRLYMLQTRGAKRPPQAAVRVAVDMVAEGILDKRQAIGRIDAGKLEALLHPAFDPEFEIEALAHGVPASPGAAKGEVVFAAERAVERAGEGAAVILVRPFTEADDVAGFDAARGILTSEGGKASHAALVARGMGRPCVCGASELEIDLEAREMQVDGRIVREGEPIAIDGTSGVVTVQDVPLVEAELDERFRTVLEWADELRTLGVRANADRPEDARKAHRFGAEGVGLCRTEHMFLGERQPAMQRMIMAAGEGERRAALAELEPLQRADFEGLFAEMAGLPVTIRLLDPPLHEFLPRVEDLVAEIERRLVTGREPAVERLERELHRVRQLEESNPMLGTRGCRLGLEYPEIYEMQVRAIAGAAAAVRDRLGSAPELEIMIPLVDYEAELEAVRELVERTAAEAFAGAGAAPVPFRVGTMIELPRACLIAGRLVERADFFSFGTNDLTQTALGFSRDDSEGRFLTEYLRRKIVARSPFESIDVEGVGELVRIAVERGRAVRPDLGLGVCGEHGGDPDSIAFFHEAGLDYVSCSPFRVPIARVAAAQAAVAAR
jgi:pyruvate,orthophosphate dikinase